MPEPLVFSIPLQEGKEAHRDSSDSKPLSLQIKLYQAHEQIEEEDDNDDKDDKDDNDDHDNNDNNDNNDDVTAVSTIETSDIMHDTGLVMWPSSVMLARYLTQHPSIVRDCSGDILELGAGCGLVGLTAARLLQLHDDDDNNNTNNRSDVSNNVPQNSNSHHDGLQ
jgi:hypothetical protein